MQHKIVSAILSGLRAACSDSVAFNGFEYPDIKPEYLLTVNVAQQIKRECEDLVIRLEETTSEVAKKCLPGAAKDLIEYFTNLKNFEEKVSRDGKFDIVLYPDSYRENALAVVELKGFQAPTDGIREDIRTRVRYQKLLNKHFGNNLQITTTAHADTVYDTLFKNEEEINAYDDEDLGDEVKERVHYVGVVVLVERKLVVTTGIK
jgi:hypothetical protein